MSYLVFARKWRPLYFEDVVGQEHITDTLKRAIEKDRVAHAYIFTGTRGVGKTTSARILARALNCEKGPTPNPCGECASCKSVISGNSFDVMEIDGASNNGVDQIRELRDNIGYTSMGGKYRIIIIDEVHMLSTGAFNALLKTLEEPPEKVIFIFATTEPHKIPDTIHSRCQRFDFRAISEEQVGGHLKKICMKENISFDEQSIALISHKAAGSMRDSLSLLDQVYSFCGENLVEDQVRSVLGLVSTEVYREILRAIDKGDSARVISIFEETLNSGYDIGEFLTSFRDFLRTLLFLTIPGGKSGLTPENELAYQQVASQFSEGDLMRMSDVLAAAEKELRFSSIPRFTVELALIKLSTMERTVTLNAILEMVKTGNYDGLKDIQLKERAQVNRVIVETPAKPIVEAAPVAAELQHSNPVAESESAENIPVEPVPVESVVPVEPEIVPVEPVIPVAVAVPVLEQPVVPVEPEIIPVEPVMESIVPVEPVMEEPVVPTEPVVPVEPAVAEPIVSTEPESNVPVEPESNVPVEPIESVLPMESEPLPAVEPVVPEPVAPVAETTPVMEPVAETTPVMKPVAESTPVMEPVVEPSVSVEPEPENVTPAEADSLGEPMVPVNGPDVPKEEPAPVADVQVSGDIRREWTRFLHHFSKNKPVLAAWLQLGSVAEVTADSIDIRFAPSYTFQQHELSGSENRSVIEAEIEKFSGVYRKLHLTIAAVHEAPERVENTPQAGAPAAPAAKVTQEKTLPRRSNHAAAIEDEIEKEPIIGSLLDKFNAEVL